MSAIVRGHLIPGHTVCVDGAMASCFSSRGFDEKYWLNRVQDNTLKEDLWSAIPVGSFRCKK